MANWKQPVVIPENRLTSIFNKILEECRCRCYFILFRTSTPAIHNIYIYIYIYIYVYVYVYIYIYIYIYNIYIYNIYTYTHIYIYIYCSGRSSFLYIYINKYTFFLSKAIGDVKLKIWNFALKVSFMHIFTKTLWTGRLSFQWMLLNLEYNILHFVSHDLC